MARSGMVDLINEFRSMVDDSGSVAFTDERAQRILDHNRQDFWQHPLDIIPREANGSIIYTIYRARYENLEGTTSGTAALRIYDSNGTASTSFTVDERRGIFTFTANQAGSARYLDGRSYDLNGAAADGWRERAGQTADDYSFQVEDRRFNRSDWFDHCHKMAEYYDRMRMPSAAVIERGDMFA